MTDEPKKHDPPLHLDMPFGEALERFAKTRTEDVLEGKHKKSRTKKISSEHMMHKADIGLEPQQRKPR
jgi:hypothetical protein